MTLGEKIRIARSKKKMSQQELSEKAGTHQKNIFKYEKDLVVPSATTLKAIADTLEVTTDFLLGSENTSIKDTSLFNQFKVADNLPDNEKGSLMTATAYVRDYKTRQAYIA